MSVTISYILVLELRVRVRTCAFVIQTVRQTRIFDGRSKVENGRKLRLCLDKLSTHLIFILCYLWN